MELLVEGLWVALYCQQCELTVTCDLTGSVDLFPDAIDGSYKF